MVKIVYLEGCIGCGKSSCIRELRKRGFEAHEEDLEGFRFLEEFYEDPKRYAFALQISILASMMRQRNNALKSASDVVFLERSPKGSLAFILNSYRNGHLSQKEYATLMDMMEVTQQHSTSCTSHIFLDTKPRECFARMSRRSRSCEANVPLEYVETIYANTRGIFHLSPSVDGSLSCEDVVQRVLEVSEISEEIV